MPTDAASAAAAAASGNIRVFVHWDENTVFAGEDIKCRVTFKNVAPPNNHADRQRQPFPLALVGTPRKSAFSSSNSNGLTPPVSARGTRGHRATLSLNVPNGHSRSKSGSTPSWVPQPPPPTTPRSGHAHKRSVSIVSINSATSSATIEDPSLSNGNGNRMLPPQRPGRGHGRSASLQISPRGSGGAVNGPQSASLPQRSHTAYGQASPVFNNHSFPPSRYGQGRMSGVATVPNTPGPGQSPRKGSLQMPDWKFPMVRSPLSESQATSPNGQEEDYITTPASTSGGGMTHTPVKTKETSIPSVVEHPAPAARILSTTSLAEGTPRSSGDFYSMSNNSSETLASEYVTQPLRNGVKPLHLRRSSGIPAAAMAKLPETLMMGYAQVQGSFTLDGSLINLGPFEAVKRKAVLGGQGGGVIGLEPSKRDSSGLLKSFGWGSWGNSIGELLGSNELSSIKEMRGTASSKSIPLLSTPQSILFVDLQLAPGESKSFEYTFKIPKGLPPTHKGKAMKITYSLVIGTQRPGGTREQQVRSVDIPFRVLGSVNSHGEILGHDLMSPYIILRDLAKVQQLEKHASSVVKKKHNHPVKPESTLQGFLGYVEELLDRPRNGGGLLSPTAQGPSSRRPSAFEEAATARDAIDLAILRSNLSSYDSGQSTNRFEIARNGQKVGVVMLARPAYRLGEQVSMAIDFTEAEIPCYAVHAALETAERVEPAFALRSEASVHRVTRKVYGSSSEATLFSRRVVFSPTIPISATPEFMTSGLSLEWKIRVEFVVPSSSIETEEAERRREGPHALLEEISRDDRGGLVMVAAENLECESFEVAVPIRVYGAVCNGLERLERDEGEEGLVV